MFGKLPLNYILKNSMKDFKKYFISMVIFEIVFKIISEITIIPLGIIGINFLVQKSGNSMISNWEIITFLISPLGVITCFVWFFFFILRVFIEISGLFSIIHGENLKGIKYIFNIIKYSIYTIPKTIYHFFIKYIISLLLSIIISYIIGFIVLYFKNQNNSILLNIFQYIYENRILFTLGISAAIISLGIFIVNRIFIFHYFFIYNKNLNSSINESKKMIKPFFWEVFLSFTIIVISVSAIYLLSLLPFTLLKDFPASAFFKSNDNNLAAALVISTFYLLFTGVTLIIIPFMVCYVNNLFNFLKYGKSESETTYFKAFANHRRIAPGRKIKVFFFFSVLLVFIFITSILSVYISIPVENKLPKITAHRGSAIDAPGNSISSIIKAVSAGTDYIEFDVQTTVDGKIVLFHDKSTFSFDKNSTPVFLRTFEELMKVSIGKNFSTKYENERVPLLSEVFEKIKIAPQIALNIEIKNYAKDEKIVDAIFSLIEEYDVQNEIVISSTDYSILKRVKDISPKTRTGIILMLFFGDIINSDVDFFSISSNLVNQDLVNEIQGMGKEIHVWTVNKASDMRLFIDLGVDNIITDNPLLLLKEIYKRKFLKSTQRNYLYLLNL